MGDIPSAAEPQEPKGEDNTSALLWAFQTMKRQRLTYDMSKSKETQLEPKSSHEGAVSP